MRCNDFDCDPTVPESIEAPDVKTEGRYTSLALDSFGYPVVSYYDSGHNDLKILHCNDANCAGGGESITSPDTDGDVGQFTSLKLDSAGNPVVSYFDNTNEHLKVLHCENPQCKGAVSEAIVDDFGDVTMPSLRLDANDNPVIAYSDLVTEELIIAHCYSAACDGGKSISVPDTGGVGSWASLVLDSSGYPVVSYYDAANENLKLLHCTNANCTTFGTPQTITQDTVGDIGNGFMSLQLDASGKPVVSYFDKTDGDLKVLHCNDANCAGGDESIKSPDGDAVTNYLGAASSLRLRGGNPVIAYSDDTNDTVKVMSCNDVNCTPGGEIINEPFTSHPSPPTLLSLELDASGFPVLSFFKGPAGIYVLHCNDLYCDPTTPEVPRLVSTAGPFMSLALSGGRPTVAFFDANDLGILSCGDPDCRTNNTIAYPRTTIGLDPDLVSLAVDSRGNPVTAYVDNDGALSVVRCATPTCRTGNSLASIPSAPGTDVGRYTSLELDPSGNPVVSYLDMTAGEVQILKCDDADCAAGGDSVIFSAAVATDADTVIQDTLQLDPSGYPVLAYIDHSGFRRLRVLHCDDAACSGGGDSDLILAQPMNGVWAASLELNDSGATLRPVVAHQRFTGDTDLAFCTDPKCDPAIPAMDGPEHINAVATDSSRGISLALRGGVQFPWLSYVSTGAYPGRLVLVKCVDIDCDAFGTSEDVGTGGHSVVASLGSDQSLALGGSNRPVIAFRKQEGAAPLSGLAIAHCNDDSCNSLDESVVVVDSSPQVGEQPSLFVDDSGIPAVSYYDARNGDLKLVRCGNGDCSSGIVVTTVDSEGDVGRYSSLELDTLGNPVISYYESIGNPPTGGRLKIVHCDNPTCSGGKASTPVGTEVRVDLGDGVTVTFAMVKAPGTTTLVTTNSGPLPPSGYYLGNPPVHYEISTTADVNPPITVCITWTEGTFPAAMEPELHLFHYQVDYYSIENFGYPRTDLNKICGNPFGLSPFTLGTLGAGNNFVRRDLTNGGTTGQWSSLALDATGLPVIAYYQSAPDFDLKVQHCDDPNCGGADPIRSPDTTGDVGIWTSVAVDASGNPVVSYRENGSGDLKILHCNDPACNSGGDSVTTPDNGFVEETSLVLDPIGNPVVSYFDSGQVKLNILHCDDPNCSGSESITVPDSSNDAGYFSSVALDGLGRGVQLAGAGLGWQPCDQLLRPHERRPEDHSLRRHALRSRR